MSGGGGGGVGVWATGQVRIDDVRGIWRRLLGSRGSSGGDKVLQHIDNVRFDSAGGDRSGACQIVPGCHVLGNAWPGCWLGGGCGGGGLLCLCRLLVVTTALLLEGGNGLGEPITG